MSTGRRPPEDPPWLRCDVGDVRDPDLSTVDALATVALECQRHGERLLLVHASPALRALIAFAGLEQVLWTDEPYAAPEAGSSRSGSPNIGK
jgi:ABC-type transporter Mla MlaB component